MKKLICVFFPAFIYCTVSAQKYIPKIKVGTAMTYSVVARATGQQAGINLTIMQLTDTVKIKWNIPFVGTGSFEMGPKSVQSATKTLAEEPEADEVTTMKDDETLLIISKDTYKSMVDNKTFKLNGYTFKVEPDTAGYKINNKEADVYHAVSTKGSREIWVLNNPDFPLICKARKVTNLIDFQLVLLTE